MSEIYGFTLQIDWLLENRQVLPLKVILILKRRESLLQKNMRQIYNASHVTYTYIFQYSILYFLTMSGPIK